MYDRRSWECTHSRPVFHYVKLAYLGKTYVPVPAWYWTAFFFLNFCWGKEICSTSRSKRPLMSSSSSAWLSPLKGPAEGVVRLKMSSIVITWTDVLLNLYCIHYFICLPTSHLVLTLGNESFCGVLICYCCIDRLSSCADVDPIECNLT